MPALHAAVVPDAPNGPLRRQAILLSPTQRWFSGLFGLAASGGGAAAVFITSNQAGATTLLLAGALGLLMALTGRVPDRIGREGIIHEPVDAPATRALGELLADPELDAEAKARVAQAVQEEFKVVDPTPIDRSNLTRLASPRTPITGTWLRSVSSAILYEHAVLAALGQVLPRGARLLRAPAAPREVDALIEPIEEQHQRHPRSLAVEVKSTRINADSLARLTNWTAPRFGALLLVVPRGSTVKVQPPVRLVEFGTLLGNEGIHTTTEDFDALKDAVAGAWQSITPASE